MSHGAAEHTFADATQHVAADAHLAVGTLTSNPIRSLCTALLIAVPLFVSRE
jgi:hypothetical protein